MLLSSIMSFGGRGMNSSWDAIWDVESKLYEDSYITEIKIPFNHTLLIIITVKPQNLQTLFQCEKRKPMVDLILNFCVLRLKFILKIILNRVEIERDKNIF